MKRLKCLGLILVFAVIGLFVGCGGGKSDNGELTVLLRMMPAQQRYFREEIIKSFEKKNKCKINIATFNNQWDIERMLKLEAGKKNPEIGLVKTPFEMTRVLVSKGYMQRLDEVEEHDKVINDMAEYHPVASGLGIIGGNPYYIPRKLETRILFYRKSKVADAVNKFDKYKDEINTKLKEQNGYGLPAEYVFESDPNLWDFYDLYVVGTIWSKEKYNDASVGRLAHRGARYGGTSLFLIDKALQLGATQEDILRLTSDKVTELFLWERVFIRDGLYNPGMWQDPWKGSNIYNGIKDGKVYLAYLQQIDCFLVHGWENDPGMQTYLPDVNDMGLSVVPKAVSFELDTLGKPLYEGNRSISTGGWWWGIPKTCPNAKLAYDFARYITNKENHAKECSKFGMLPVRKDILNNLPKVFDEGWVGDIYEVSAKQVKTQLNSEKLITVPLIKEYQQIGQNYIEAWYKLCVEYDAKKDGAMDFSTMKMRLGSDYLPKQQEILGENYPK